MDQLTDSRHFANGYDKTVIEALAPKTRLNVAGIAQTPANTARITRIPARKGCTVTSNLLFSFVTQMILMNEDTRWKLIAGTGLVTLSLAMMTVHYLIFQDLHHIFIYFIYDLAFIPIEVLVVTLIIDQMLESREKQRRMEKLNMVIGTFFSTIGTPLLARISGYDPAIDQVKSRLVMGNDWNTTMFSEVKKCLNDYTCSVATDRIDIESLRTFLVNNEDFMIRIVENPMVFEHESFTNLVFAINHLAEELKARDDLSRLPAADKNHLSKDIERVYSQLFLEWIRYMEYLKIHYPYLFSLAMRKNPFDAAASVIIRE